MRFRLAAVRMKVAGGQCERGVRLLFGRFHLNGSTMSDTENTPKSPPNPPDLAAPEKPADKPPGKKPRFERKPRVSAPVPSLEDDLRINPKPSLKDLDAEIEGELAAAFGGLSEQDLLAAETSQEACKSAEGQSPRKKGKVLSVHGADVFVDVPGGRSQGALPLQQFPDGPPAADDD